ncbi:MAG: EamA family transporter [Clostridia bacterium]|nr:EamA family transporter [Clostridia bacterium]
MSWFFLALICMIGWGCADLFYKKGTDDSDRYSHLKTAVWVGLVMGICSFILMPFAETPVQAGAFLSNALKYAPASLSYIISMIIGYAGLRYLELSIVSPIQNGSGAMSAICMLVFFVATGKISNISEEFPALQWVGVVFIVAGVIALAAVERRLSAAETPEAGKKYRFGALALLFPLAYCLFDTIGTAADGIILDEETGLGLGEIDVLVLYGLTFLLAGIICYVFLWIREGKPYNPFARTEWSKGVAACCEECGQVFYVYAMAREPVLAAPMVASYCIISVILSRIFVKEKLKASQYACVISVIIGIVILGICDGIYGE